MPRLRHVLNAWLANIIHGSRFALLRLKASSLGAFCVANGFITEVEEAHGSTARAACNIKAKLVEAELEMVHAAGLFQCGAAVSVVRWISTRDRFQRDEIDGCLQRSISPREV